MAHTAPLRLTSTGPHVRSAASWSTRSQRRYAGSIRITIEANEPERATSGRACANFTYATRDPPIAIPRNPSRASATRPPAIRHLGSNRGDGACKRFCSRDRTCGSLIAQTASETNSKSSAIDGFSGDPLHTAPRAEVHGYGQPCDGSLRDRLLVTKPVGEQL
jgi:hypothetical protein